MHEVHTLKPFFNSDSRILILGSFPSVASRDAMFYYAHKTNRFWPILSALTGQDASTLEEKKNLLSSHHIALYDVIESCSIVGSEDSKIKDAEPSDLSIITKNANIEVIFTNGNKASSLYKRYLEKEYGKAIALPSTSSANASMSFERLLEKWIVLKKYI